jgi:ParB-like chromosome segregation protein Spo0J
MKLALRPVELDAIRTDGGTQVRERLDEAWVVELVALYEDGGHDIDPILLMEEGTTLWLVDGFHRVEAMKRARLQGCSATVRVGSLDAAKMLAARMNKNGLPRTAGDKKRAILLALSTQEGKRMGVRELARHVGVAESYVRKVTSGDCAPVRTDGLRVESPPARSGARDVLWSRIDAALREDDRRPSKEIADLIGCDDRTVRERRRALGLPDFTKVDAIRSRPRPSVDSARDLIQRHPEWTNRRIADDSGASPETVAKLRGEAGMEPRPRGGAVPRKKVVDATPILRAKERAPRPPVPSYSTMAWRDFVKKVMADQRTAREKMGEADWQLFLAEWDEGAAVRDGRGEAAE